MDIDAELSGARGDHHLGQGADSRFWGNAGAGVLARARDTGRYLLLLRSPYVNEPGTWHMASGKIDGGEDPEQAAAREFKEETGYSGALALRLVDTFEHGNFRFHNYAGEVPSEFTPTLDWESSDFMWAAKADFPAPLHFGLRRIMGLFEAAAAFIHLLEGSVPLKRR